jgi:hypothetical protein
VNRPYSWFVFGWIKGFCCIKSLCLDNDFKTQKHNEESGVISCEPQSLSRHLTKLRHSLLKPI